MAVKVNNTYADAYYWQAKCFEALHKKEEAIKNYQTALALDKELKEAKVALQRLQQQNVLDLWGEKQVMRRQKLEDRNGFA